MNIVSMFKNNQSVNIASAFSGDVLKFTVNEESFIGRLLELRYGYYRFVVGNGILFIPIDEKITGEKIENSFLKKFVNETMLAVEDGCDLPVLTDVRSVS